MHLPSSLSHLYYINYLFTYKIVEPYNHNIIIGKPFGSDAYYYVWKKLGLLQKNKQYSYGIKHEELPFVNFSEETLGNALGVASGIALGNNKLTWVNLSDASLQMGPTLEAIQFIGFNNQNIKITIDFNNWQLTGKLRTCLKNIENTFKANNWQVFIIKNKREYFKLKRMFDHPGPVCIIICTKKGDGVKEMENNPTLWHYKNLKDLNEITISKELTNLGFFTSLGYVESN